MASWVKLTVRLPERLHGRLRRSARSEGQSLNAHIISTLRAGLTDRSSTGTDERERISRHLREAGMVYTVGPQPASPESVESYRSFRESLTKTTSLSDLIIEERGPR